MSHFVACRKPVLNRGSAPYSFLEELVTWGKTADPVIFQPKPIYEIYSDVEAQLGPYPPENLEYRKAVMLEVLRVLAGFESSWKWDAGRDTTNPDSDKPCTMEAGAFQVSGDSMNFDGSLRTFARKVAGTDDCNSFREVTKTNHPFAIEYCARLLRFTLNHHGPIKHHQIQEWLSRDAVHEFGVALNDNS
ncbi:hypothetical protein [Burkholderia sp. NLJ2]|uniref:hypothetical protein n=1 Tax=Burkholderia sp. NLJ2 TaxID=3090699 RepID=UPI003C6C5B5F